MPKKMDFSFTTFYLVSKVSKNYCCQIYGGLLLMSHVILAKYEASRFWPSFLRGCAGEKGLMRSGGNFRICHFHVAMIKGII